MKWPFERKIGQKYDGVETGEDASQGQDMKGFYARLKRPDRKKTTENHPMCGPFHGTQDPWVKEMETLAELYVVR